MLLAQFHEASGCEIAVESKRLANTEVRHRHKTSGIDKGELAVVAFAQPVERPVLERLADVLDTQPR